MADSDKNDSAEHKAPLSLADEDGAEETAAAATKKKKKVVVKIGMVGDSQIGKTSLMVKYVEGNWNEDYIQTLGWCNPARFLLSNSSFLAIGVNFMEKTVSLKNTDVTFSIWDLGGALQSQPACVL